MRAPLLAVAVIALLSAANAVAGERSVTARFSWPLPAGEIGDRTAGLDAGVSVDRMELGWLGLGLDVGYHYWPASDAYRAAYDDYLAATHGQRIDAKNWSVSVYQVTPHARFVAPISERLLPWAQLGGGMYYFDRNLAAPDWTGSNVIYFNTKKVNSFLPGWTAAVGLDFRISPRSLVGLTANYHDVASNDSESKTFPIPPFRVVALGTQFRFDW